MTGDSALESPLADKTMFPYKIIHTVLIYMSSKLPKLGLSSQGSVYNQQSEKHLHRLIWGMQTRPCSVLPAREANLFFGGGGNFLIRDSFFSLNCTKMTGCY